MMWARSRPSTSEPHSWPGQFEAWENEYAVKGSDGSGVAVGSDRTTHSLRVSHGVVLLVMRMRRRLRALRPRTGGKSLGESEAAPAVCHSRCHWHRAGVLLCVPTGNLRHDDRIEPLLRCDYPVSGRRWARCAHVCGRTCADCRLGGAGRTVGHTLQQLAGLPVIMCAVMFATFLVQARQSRLRHCRVNQMSSRRASRAATAPCTAFCVRWACSSSSGDRCPRRV